MVFVVVGLVLVGALGLLNLALSIAIVRRLRRQEEQRRAIAPDASSGPEVGTAVPAFTAPTLGGKVFASASLAGGTAALSFITTSCGACDEFVSEMPEFAAKTGLDDSRIVVVIAGEQGKARQMADHLDGLATVVYEAAPGDISSLYSITATPTTVITDAHQNVTATHTGTKPHLQELPA
ncbi:TlpA family protein disulfide reductase [Streptomyces sp. NPDC057689]|uniref:TlpA family protein disulfide reductase n=1 Tax=Streptomyces sp. NPDC057689 TaxID=3346213 RepID=UPI0036A1EBE0